MKKALFLLFLIVSPAFAQEQIVDFTESSLPVLNEELRRIRADIRNDSENYVSLTGAETVAGVKTFSSFPITPSSAPTTDYQVANVKFVNDTVGGVSTVPTFAAGSVVFAFSDTETSATATAYTKAKEILVGTSGTITVYFELKNSTGDAAHHAKGRIYVNGSAVGTERDVATNVYEAFSENITVAAGDLVQLYAHGQAGFFSGVVSNFRLKCANFLGGYMRISTVGGSAVTEAP